MRQVKGHANHLGLRGWLVGGRWGPDRYLYSLHRLTGLGLLVYFVAHIFVTAARVRGETAWNDSMAAVSGPWLYFGEYLVFAAFAFHAVNGLRLIFAELGFGVGKPIEPIYPYRTALDVQRPWVIGMLIVAGLIAVIGALDFFLWH